MSLSAISRNIEALTAEMRAAVAAEDFERAARLCDEIAVLKGEAGAGQGPEVRKPPPGQIGLGTNVPVVAPPKGWTPPKKPDLKTNVKPRKR